MSTGGPGPGARELDWARALQESKLHVPPQRPGAVNRTLLDGRGSDSRIVTVVAPAGYGKSMLLGQWARSEPRIVAWVSLDAHDDDPVALLTVIAEACAVIAPTSEALVGGMRGLGDSALSRSAPMLASVLSAAPHPFVLFIDDVHTASSPACRDVLEVVLGGIPEGSQVVLASRHRLPYLGRMWAAGDVSEVSAEDLRMSALEARTLFMDVGATEQDIALLVERCEGWAAGLFLCALMSARHGGLRALSGDDRYLSDYLYHECFDGLSSELQDFLRASAVLDELNPQLCDAVIGGHSSAARIRELEDLNLFLMPVDGQGGWYRYHALFREFLLSELLVDVEFDAAELHRRAARWYEEHGIPESAIDHWLAAEDRDAAARLIATTFIPTWRKGKVAVVERWMSGLGESVITSQPALITLACWSALLQGRVIDAERWLSMVDNIALSRPADDVEFESTRAMIDSIMCVTGPQDALISAARAVALVPTWGDWRGPSLFLYGMSALLTGDESTARESFTGGAHTSGILLNSAALAVLAADAGEWGDAADHSQEAVRAIEASHMDGYSTAALAFAVSARVALQRGDVQDSERHLAKALRARVACTHLMPFYAVQVRIQIAKAMYAKGDLTAATIIMREIDALVHQRPHLGRLLQDVEAFRRELQSGPRGGTNTTPLTPAELRVLPYLQTHLTMSDIAQRLVVSRNTISTQVVAIYRKLGVNTRSEAVERATGLGMLGV